MQFRSKNLPSLILVEGGTINSWATSLDSVPVPRYLRGFANFPWLDSELLKLGYSYDRVLSWEHGAVVYRLNF